MGEHKRNLPRDPKSYDYREYTLYVPSGGAAYIKRYAAIHGVTEENYIRIAIAEQMHRDQEKESLSNEPS